VTLSLKFIDTALDYLNPLLFEVSYLGWAYSLACFDGDDLFHCFERNLHLSTIIMRTFHATIAPASKPGWLGFCPLRSRDLNGCSPC
jgi:hypothetical protein